MTTFMRDTICSREGCEKKAKSRTLCGTHYVYASRDNSFPVPVMNQKGIRKNTGRTHIQKGQEPWNKGRAYLEIRGEKNHNWKGDGVGNSALHSWVKRKLGTPNQCQHCHLISDNPNMIQWANKSWQYKRDINDWLRLCAKCHKAYDTHKLTLEEIGV